MKKLGVIFVIIIMLTCLLLLTACPKELEVEKEKITTLVGTWKEILREEDKADRWLTVEITSDTITVCMMEYYGSQRYVKWIGTYSDPIEPVEEYTFQSLGRDTNNNERTRTFTYSDGKLMIEIGLGEVSEFSEQYAYFELLTKSN